MKILLIGVTGYIAQRLLPVLLDKGHEVVCCVRDKDRFNAKKYAGQRLTVIEVDFLNDASLGAIPEDIEAAYYLIHSMATQEGDFGAMEEICATHFRKRLEQTKVNKSFTSAGLAIPRNCPNTSPPAKTSKPSCRGLPLR
jgi:putative NADH-flavin reductase